MLSRAVIARSVAAQLTSADDPRLWEVVIQEVLRDAEALCLQTRSKSSIFIQIGACSHWQRPHQHRWLKDGSFAAPYGYGGTGFNIHAWPVLEWSIFFRWDPEATSWARTEKVRGKRPLVLRIAVPTRSRVHAQAAVHSVWTPGSPTIPKQEILRLYGFRRRGQTWKCTATAGHEFPYEAKTRRKRTHTTARPRRKAGHRVTVPHGE
jgi:hypothetical protein